MKVRHATASRLSRTLGLAVALFFAREVRSTTYYASPDGAADADCTENSPGTIARAVSKATASGDIVQLAAGTYSHTNASINLSVDGITLQGATDNPADTVIKGIGNKKAFTAFVVTKQAVVKDVTMSAFYTGAGGCVAGGRDSHATAASNLKAYNCIISDNKTMGAVVYGGFYSNCVFSCNTTTNIATAYSSSCFDCIFTNNAITGNTAFGGALGGSGSVASNCLFTSNRSSHSAGAGSGGTYYDCFFTNNTCKYYGGALQGATAYRCVFTVNKGGTGGAVSESASRSCRFVSNTSTGHGGAGYKGSFYDCFVTNNRATGSSSFGGGFYGESASALVASNCCFIGNSTPHSAGAGSGGTYYDCAFTNNSSKYNGGALNGATAYRCEFKGNSCGTGAAVNDCTSRSCRFVSNKATSYGGAGYKGSFYDCVFTNNQATGTSASGGAITSASSSYAYASNCVFLCNSSAHSVAGAGYCRLYDCAFTNNTSKYNGGSAGDCILYRCNIYGGKAGSGSAIYKGSAYFCTIGWNQPGTGAGMYQTKAEHCVIKDLVSSSAYDLAVYQGTLKNCLIAGNTLTANNSGSIVKGSVCVNCTIVGNTTKGVSAISGGTYTNCIISANSYDVGAGTYVRTLYSTTKGSPTLVNCIQKSDAKFNKDGDPSLPYYYLRQNSPARNAGIDAGWTESSVDLRGKKRLVGAVDLGCYEFQPTGFKFIVR